MHDHRTQHDPPKHANGRSRSRFRARGGISVLELIVTMVLLGAALASVVPLIKRIDLLQREVGRQELALQTSQNLLERLTASAWADVTPANADKLVAETSLSADLPEGVIKVTVTDVESPIPARRITVEITWRNHSGQRVAPMVLSTMVSQREVSP